MIGILCSAVGLGHYVPGLLMQRELAAAGIESTVVVFESFLGDEQRQALVRTRSAYQRNAALVHIGRKILLKMRMQPSIGVDGVRDQVDLADIDRFAVISGFWIPLLVELEQRQRFMVDVLHVDAVSSPSWDVVRDGVEQLRARRFWFSNHATGRMEHRVRVQCEVIPLAGRSNAVLAHGGGWAVGAYKDAAARIAGTGYAVHVVVPDTEDAPPWAAAVYRIDPEWEAWSPDSGPPSFPPLVGESAELGSSDGRPYHDVLEIGRHMMAVVSKPGGATILDCIETGTPLIYAQPEGEHEARNAELWSALGFAMSLDEWAATGFNTEPLMWMHEALIRARREIPTYVERRILDRP